MHDSALDSQGRCVCMYVCVIYVHFQQLRVKCLEKGVVFITCTKVPLALGVRRDNRSRNSQTLSLASRSLGQDSRPPGHSSIDRVAD